MNLNIIFFNSTTILSGFIKDSPSIYPVLRLGRSTLPCCFGIKAGFCGLQMYGFGIGTLFKS